MANDFNAFVLRCWLRQCAQLAGATDAAAFRVFGGPAPVMSLLVDLLDAEGGSESRAAAIATYKRFAWRYVNAGQWGATRVGALGAETEERPQFCLVFPFRDHGEVRLLICLVIRARDHEEAHQVSNAVMGYRSLDAKDGEAAAHV